MPEPFNPGNPALIYDPDDIEQGYWYEIKRYRAAERAEEGFDGPPVAQVKDWRLAVSRITDLELFAEVVAAGEAIRHSEWDEPAGGDE